MSMQKSMAVRSMRNRLLVWKEKHREKIDFSDS